MDPRGAGIGVPGAVQRDPGAVGARGVQAGTLRSEGLWELEEGESRRKYRFLGAGYRARARAGFQDPDARRLSVRDLAVEGILGEGRLDFTVSGSAHTLASGGARALVLGGDAALASMDLPPGAAIVRDQEGYHLEVDGPGERPFSFGFVARVSRNGGWQEASFHLPQAALIPLDLGGFDAGTSFRNRAGGTVVPREDGFRTFLPADGRALLAWKGREEEASSRLFYSTESLARILMGTGVMRQESKTLLSVMQGELEALGMRVFGSGEITQVAAQGLLSWSLSEEDAPGTRTLQLRFNQPLSGETAIQISVLTSLGSFPLETEPVRIVPLGATRHHGRIEVANQGAVRLNIAQTTGLSRISPGGEGAVPEPRGDGAYPLQRFAFRHSSTDYGLAVEVDDIEPEISASALILHHLGHDQIRIDADLELEVREAPVRELSLRIPADHVVAEVQSDGLSDYFVQPLEEEEGLARLRLEFAQPVAGRHRVALRLERNQALESEVWTPGTVLLEQARQLRGHIGITSVQGFRISPAAFSGVAEIATVYFPRQVQGLQAAFQITGNAWEIQLQTLPIPQEIQADCTHLHTIGNGLIHGSSVIQFAISGAPIDTFRFSIPEEYRNVEFTGEGVRNWVRTEAGYDVQLQSPIMGLHTILVSHERPFSDQSDTLDATGTEPLDATSEEGTIILTSRRPIQLEVAQEEGPLLRLAPGEISIEHRLLLSQPVLAAFQYHQRPISLALDLSTPIEQASLRQIVDRAQFRTQISQDGQTVTRARYVVKSAGLGHIGISLPEGDQLLSSPTVDGRRIVPINSGDAFLVPLSTDSEGPEHRLVELSIKSDTRSASDLRISLPEISAPILHSRWRVEPDQGHLLAMAGGTLAPAGARQQRSGFQQLRDLFQGRGGWAPGSLARLMAGGVLILLASGLLLLVRQENFRSHRWRRLACLGLGGLSGLLGLLAWAAAMGGAPREAASPSNGALEFDYSLTIPSEPPWIQVRNRPAEAGAGDYARGSWPLAGALLIALAGRLRLEGKRRFLAYQGAWLFAILGALSWPSGAWGGLALILLFLCWHWLFPALRLGLAAGGRSLPAALLLCLAAPLAQAGAPRSVVQQLSIGEGAAAGRATLEWEAGEGETLALLREPAVLVSVEMDEEAVALRRGSGEGRAVGLLARRAGRHMVVLEYQVATDPGAASGGFLLPTPSGLVNRIEVALELPRADLVVEDAVALQKTGEEEGATRWTVIPRPSGEVRIGWRPRLRDRSGEETVYFAEIATLLIPGSGLIESVHNIAIRPTQGEVRQVRVAVPEGVAISDAWTPHLSRWRFEPESNLLDIQLSQPQIGPFPVRVRSQWMTGPLPYSTTLAFPSVPGASSQPAMVAVATGGQVQIARLEPAGMVPIDPQDFPRVQMEQESRHVPGARIRQAFRYNDPDATLELEAAAVAPHVVVSTRERLSIGEDRITHAVSLDCTVSRAGIFHLEFALPEGMNIESVSGSRLSHWTESLRGQERIIALHLPQRSMGQMDFDLTLSGPGLSPDQDQAWSVPRVLILEAGRQDGHLLLVPEQGIHLQLAGQANVSPVDPGARQEAAARALAFDLLNRDWSLAFEVEQMEAWVEATSLQDALFTEGKVRITQHLDFRIKNSAIKSLLFDLPEEAENVDFEGAHITDEARSGDSGPGSVRWEVSLQRRIIDGYRLRLTYEMRLPEEEAPFALSGARVAGANLQRSFLVLRSRGRLQTTLGEIPPSLYATDWHNIPGQLRRYFPSGFQVEHAFRAVSPDFQLPLTVSRRQIVDTLTAEVEDFALTTLLSQNGSHLTRAAIRLSPGNKRSLEIRLPPGHTFWFARIDGQTVSPLDQGDRQLIPLIQDIDAPETLRVEVFFEAPPSPAEAGRLDATLRSLSLDLAARRVDWTVILDPFWKLEDWEGDLQFVEELPARPGEAADLDTYLSRESERFEDRNREAEVFLQRGNTLLQEGDEQQALFNFKNAYIQSEQDSAFNEDARVQMRALQANKAMAGMAAQQARQRNQDGAQLDLDPGQNLTSQQVLEQIQPDNSAELRNLANRLVQQQDEAVEAPRGFEVGLPEQGERLVFLKSVQVDSLDGLSLSIRARSERKDQGSGTALAFVLLAVTALGLSSRLLPRKDLPIPEGGRAPHDEAS